MADFHLSKREFDVIDRYCRGERNKDISATLKLSPKSVYTYKKRAMAKMGVKTLYDASEKLKDF